MSHTSSPERLYVVTLTAAEVDAIESHLGRAVGAKLAPAPRKPATSETSRPWHPVGPAPTQHQHLTPEAEAWLAKRHDPAFAPRPIATPPLGKPKALTDKQRAEHEGAWAWAVRDYWRNGRHDLAERGVRAVAMLDALTARA